MKTANWLTKWHTHLASWNTKHSPLYIVRAGIIALITAILVAHSLRFVTFGLSLNEITYFLSCDCSKRNINLNPTLMCVMCFFSRLECTSMYALCGEFNTGYLEILPFWLMKRFCFCFRENHGTFVRFTVIAINCIWTFLLL